MNSRDQTADKSRCIVGMGLCRIEMMIPSPLYISLLYQTLLTMTGSSSGS